MWEEWECFRLSKRTFLEQVATTRVINVGGKEVREDGDDDQDEILIAKAIFRRAGSNSNLGG